MIREHSIIRTRITVPRRREELVARHRLNDLLDKLVEKRLVLVSAPAGYGKTSLMVDFASTCHLPVCWYAIDRLDFDPQRFISHFIAAIHQRFPNFGQRTRTALSGDQGQFDPDYITTILINDLYENVSEHFLFILDDYHLVNESLQVRNFISRFLQDVEENCHLVLTSRSLLSLPILPMMAARGEVGGISFEELAFQTDEIQSWYQKSQSQILSLQTAEEIRQKTEGWITGIVLVSQINQQGESDRTRLARVSGFGIDEYYLEIINNLPEDHRTFLLRSSLLEEFNADRCALVIGRALGLEAAPWQEWMDKTQLENLFVLPVGEQGDWLRYHPLFLDFLQTRIFREKPDEALSIEQNLALVSLQNNEWERAFSIYRRLNKSNQLVDLIEAAGPDILAAGQISTLSSWLDSLPVETLNTRPFIVALQGYIAMALGNTSLALTLYNQAAAAMSLPEDRLQLAKTLSMRATLQRLNGRLDSAISDANESMQLINNDLDQRKLKGELQRCIGISYFYQGALQKALIWLKDALDVMLSINDERNQAVIHLEIGLVYENLGAYDLSKENYLAALEYWRKVENPIWLSNLLNNLGVLYQMMGEYEHASHAFEEALEFAHASGYSRMEGYILTGIGDIYAELQADEQAAEAYKQASILADRTQEHFLQVYILVQSAALAGYRGDLAEGHKFIQKGRLLVMDNGSEIEKYLCDLEYSGLKILENRPQEIIPKLEEACEYFGREGHKVQYQKAHLYLVLAYKAANQSEKIIENFLHIVASLHDEYPPVALIGTATRFRTRLDSCQMDYLRDGFVQLFAKIEEFTEKQPLLRRYLRKNSRAVPFAAPTLFVRALGRMQVQINNHLITSSEWQTTAARDMFFMLLAHPEGMTKEEISLIFWPDATEEDTKFRFKNTVYRLRRAVGKNSVILDQDIYRFNNNLDYEYDVELFLKENALASQAHDPMQKLSHFREAIKHYRNNYLCEIEDTWVYSTRESLRMIYLGILLQVSEIYLNQSNYELAMEYCQRTLNEDNLLEDAYRLALRIFAAQGNRAALVRQYQRCVEILEREINSPPSPQTQALYQELLR
jgi:LuxR family transcriptional regulator, maltose regulon positive regulatory protein